MEETGFMRFIFNGRWSPIFDESSNAGRIENEEAKFEKKKEDRRVFIISFIWL